VVLLGACASGTVARLPPGEGTTSFMLREPRGEAVVRSVLLVVDGRRVYDQHEREPGEIELSRLALDRTDHIVSVMVTAEYQDAAVGRCEIDLGIRMRLTSGASAATVAVELDMKAGSTPADQRTELTMSAKGATLLAPRANANQVTSSGTVHCYERTDPIETAICIARTRIESARKLRDVVALTCVNDKLTQLQVLQMRAQDAQEASAKAPSSELKGVVQQAEDDARELGVEADHCAPNPEGEVALFEGKRVRCPAP
jgi:hypothetical protein